MTHENNAHDKYVKNHVIRGLSRPNSKGRIGLKAMFDKDKH